MSEKWSQHPMLKVEINLRTLFDTLGTDQSVWDDNLGGETTFGELVIAHCLFHLLEPFLETMIDEMSRSPDLHSKASARRILDGMPRMMAALTAVAEQGDPD